MLGDKIKELRKKHKITQFELAEKLGITPSAVGMYEQNRREPNYEILDLICKIFSVTYNDLLSDNEEDYLDASVPTYQTKSSNTEDLSLIIEDLKQNLLEQKGLMFKGEALDDEDLEKIFEAMKIGAEVAINSKK